MLDLIVRSFTLYSQTANAYRINTMKYSIKITKNGQFHAYLGDKGEAAWTRKTAEKLLKSASQKEHFQGFDMVLENDKRIIVTK